MRIVIGLTGPTGAGKSSVCLVARELGFKVVDCDLLARVAVEKGSSGLKRLCEVFGNGILLSDGSLNRKALAQIAFSSRENTELLNKTLLPYITILVEREIDTDYVLLDAPTLFESGLQDRCHKTIAVLSSEDLRLERIMSRDNIDVDAAKLRISAGKSDEFYIKNADKVFYNNANLQEFLLKIKEYLESIIGGK